MKLNILKGAVFTTILITISFAALGVLVQIYVPEIEKNSVCTYIVDGDTFDISEGHRIRLADIDTPEQGYTGYYESSEYLSHLIFGKDVYLDIDDLYVYDTTGTRLVCVVYVEYDSTRYLNVNKALLEENLAVVYDHSNEFNPYAWKLLVNKPKPSDIILLFSVSVGIGFISTLVLYVLSMRLYSFIPSRVRNRLLF